MHSRRIASVMVLAAAATVLLSVQQADADGRRYCSYGSRRHHYRSHYYRPRGTSITVFSPTSRYAASGYYGRRPYVRHIRPSYGYSSHYRPSCRRYRYGRRYYHRFPRRYYSPRYHYRRHHYGRHRSHYYPRRRSGVGISISGVFSSLFR